MYHIVFEGPDGSGKSSMANMLQVELERAGVVVHRVHQPGCNEVGTAIRRVFKGEFGKPSKEASFYLAAAEHNEFLNELKKIHTAYAFDVDHIHVLIQDRHSAVSGWAYQVCGSGVDKDLWRRVYSDYRNWPYPQDPDCIVLYYPSLATIMNRIKSRGEPSDHFEQQEFLAKVVKGYETVGVAGVLPSHLYIHESGESSLEVEYKTLIHDLAGYLEERVQHIDGERQELQLLFSKLDAIYNKADLELPKI